MRIAILFLSVLALSCSKNVQKKMFLKMDTLVEITFFSNKNAQIKNEEMFKKIENFMDDWEYKFSPSNEDSEISKCNNRQTDTLEISDDLFYMIKTANFYSEKLDGYFDISIKPLKDFWDINSQNSFLPDPKDSSISDTLSQVLRNVDYTKISLLENPKRVVFENPEIKIDLGAVAKGFAIDKIKDTLLNYEFRNFIVNIGGDIFVSGSKVGGAQIIVGIKNPRGGEVLKTIALNSKAINTSGDYERFRIARSGAKVHHIFDTKTGYPASKNISLSVTGESSLVSDILTTGLFAMPADSILIKIKEFEGYEILLIDSLENLFETDFFTEKRSKK
ncbi:MAG: FAD:protein FMN transferase [Chitinispirillales bacterium]|jgi:thiamine biosynthesis lipoprotein|nr:FAD:protein FMN transferase [Chitinispirillales bacterium]